MSEPPRPGDRPVEDRPTGRDAVHDQEHRSSTARLRAWTGLVGLGVRRVVGRLRGGQSGRTVLAVSGVALAVALLVIVTGLALGLASAGTVDSEGVNYWIVPDDGGAGSVPFAVEGARLGSVHDVAMDLQGDDRIEYASPVAIQPLYIENPETGSGVFVIALGIIPPEHDRSVAGIHTRSLDSSYGYYNDGGYDGEWTGETIVTPGVAETIEVEDGDRLTAQGSDLTVIEVAENDLKTGVGEVPAVVLPLAELQTLTGLEDGDRADQILVSTTDDSVADELRAVYPGTKVVSRGGLTGFDTSPTSLPLAVALTAGVTAGGIGIAFVATTMGLEITAGRRSIAVLSAVGVPLRGRLLVVVAESVTVTALGGILGVVLGVVGIGLLNMGVTNWIGVVSAAVVTPALLAYGLVAALIMGLCAAPYLAYLAARTDTLSELTR